VRVVLTHQAEKDLEEIDAWVARENPRRAAEFLRELRVSCRCLSDNPERFQLVDRHKSESIRRRVHGAYWIEGDQVTILRVLHGARDYEPLLFPGDHPA